MKFIGLLCVLFYSCFVQAEVVYSSVDEYVDSTIISNKNNFNHANRAVSSNKRWHAGYEPSGTSETGFLYLLEVNAQGKLKLVSRNNTNEEWRYPYLFENLVFNANDKFHVSVQVVQNGNAVHTYYFRLIKKKWFLVKDDYSELSQCGMGDQSETYFNVRTSTNYLTGNMEEQRYSKESCEPLKLIKKKFKFSLVPLSDFYPFMEVLPKTVLKRPINFTFEYDSFVLEKNS